MELNDKIRLKQKEVSLTDDAEKRNKLQIQLRKFLYQQEIERIKEKIATLE